MLSPPDYLGVSALNADTLYSVIWFDLAEPGWDDDAVKSRHSEIIGEITFDAATMPALGHPIADLFENGEQPVAENKERLSRLRQSHKDAEAAITRLLSLVEQGVMEAEDASLKERLVSLKIRRDTRG